MVSIIARKEHELYVQMCKELLRLKVITLADLKHKVGPDEEVKTDGRKLMNLIQQWANAYVEMNKEDR